MSPNAGSLIIYAACQAAVAVLGFAAFCHFLRRANWWPMGFAAFCTVAQSGLTAYSVVSAFGL